MLTLVTAPAVTPVTLTEVKADLPVIHAADDSILQLHIDAATSSLDGAEGTLGRCMVTQTWDWTLAAFPAELSVPLPILQSVTSVSYRDGLGATQVVSADDYMVSGQRITAPDGWPGTDGQPGAVTVRFVAGYGLAIAVPAALKAAILLKVRDLYEKEPGANDMAVANLCRPYKVWRV